MGNDAGDSALIAFDFKDAISIAQAAKITEKVEKFIVFQQEVRILGLATLCLVDEESLVYYHSTSSDSLFYAGNQ